MKLHQIIALVKGKKAAAQAALTESHRGWNKDAIAGITKRYTPKDEQGERIPPESKQISLDVAKQIGEVRARLVNFYDVVATQELTNGHAEASITLAGLSLPRLPVTVLLFLERQLTDIKTYITNLPVLPLDREWVWDGNRKCYVTMPVETIRTQKIPEVLVKYAATVEHPAQTEVIAKDVHVGKWETVYMSSALPADKRDAMLSRCEALLDAVKIAREEANSADAVEMKIGDAVLGFVFDGASAV